MKKTAKRALSFFLTVLMLVSTMSVGFFGITSLAASVAVSNAHKAVIAVPETVYMTPSTGASTVGKYYVNNTITEGSYTVNLEANAANTNAYLGLQIEGAKKFTVEISTLTSGIGDVVISDAGASSGSYEYSANSTNVFEFNSNGYVAWPEGLGLYINGTGLNPGETSLVEWKFTVTMNDGSTRVYYAYSTLYAPYYQPVAAGAEAWSSSTRQSWAGSLLWVQGVHGSDTKSYYPIVDKFFPMTGGFYSSGFNNARPSQWLTSTSNGYAATCHYVESNGSYHRRANAVSPVASLFVDTSRYTNFNQIPNFKVGYMVTDSEGSDEGSWYVADYTGYTSDMSDGGAGSSTKSDVGSNIYDKACGVKLASGDDKNCEFKFLNAWDKAVTTGTVQLKGALRTENNNYAIKKSAWSYTFIKMNVTGANKASLRELVLQGASFNEKNYTETTWKAYKEALANAALALGDPTNSTIDTATLTSKRDALETNVYFDTDGGTNAPAAATVKIGAKTTASYTTPSYNGTLEGHTFKGWSTTKGATTGATTVTVGFNQTLYAAWEINKYTVTWDVDGTTTTETYTHGSTPSYKNDTPTKQSDGLNEYTFTGWSPSLSAVTSDVTYEAQFSEKFIGKIITWQNEDGSPLEIQKVKVGSVITPPEAPTKEGNAQYSYTFAGWKNVDDGSMLGTNEMAENDATYIAQFTETTNVYTITWLDDKGNLIDTTTVEYGQMPTHADPTKASTTEFSYTFTGWINVADNSKLTSATTVKGNATYKATFSSTTNEYTVTWLNHDGSAITGVSPVKVKYGTTPTAPEAPARTSTAQYDFEFDCWKTKDGSKFTSETIVTGDVIYYATYTEKLRSYTIKFVNEDGKELQSSEVAYGETPAYTGNTPTKAATAKYTYTFKDWTPEVVAVTGEATYTATYTTTVNKYTVKFVDENGTVLQEGNVAYDATITPPADPTKAADEYNTYKFVAWLDANKQPFENGTTVSGDVTYTAMYRSIPRVYTITFVNENNENIGSYTHKYGETITPPADPTKEGNAQHSYTFLGWWINVDDDSTKLTDSTKVTGDATYKAKFAESTNVYTVTWMNGDTEIYSETLEYGQTPAYDEETYGKPAKEQTKESVFAFSGWDPKISKVTGDATYKATFAESAKKYTITWLVDGELYFNDEVAYGETPTHPVKDPTKEKTDEYTYTFTGWSPELEVVTSDQVYKADFSQTKNSYTITWVVDEDDASKNVTETYEYGAMPNFEGTPTKASSATTDYTFKSWDKNIVTVSGNETYKAVYTKSARMYTVTWKYKDGGEITSYQVANGSQITEIPTIAEKEGHTIEYTIPSVMPTENITIEVSYAVNSYTIKWIANESLVHSEKLAYGTRITNDLIPQVPELPGFKGSWENVPETMPANDVTITAKYINNAVTITWIVGDVKQEMVVVKDTPFTYDKADPTKDPSETEIFEFVGWSESKDGNGSIVTFPVTADTDKTYYAVFSSDTRYYTVNWVVNGVTISQRYTYNAEPVFTGSTDKESSVSTDYTFAGWDKDVTNVRADVTYTATYKESPRKYTITWIVNGAKITEQWEYNSRPTFTGSTDKASDNTTNYTFAGWDKERVNVTEDATYTATYTESVRKYIITWVVDGKTTKEEYEYENVPSFKGSTDKAPDNTTVYTFAGWNTTPVAVTGDATYTATYSESDRFYTIKWIVGDSTTTEQYKYDAAPSFKGSTDKESSVSKDYTFDGWDKEVVNVTADVTYTATYKESPRKYTITWVVNGAETKEQVEYGTVPSFTGSTDKAPSNTIVYTFAGWNTTPVAVTGPATYTATYTEADRLYTITWVVKMYVNGEVKDVEKTAQYKYGEMPSFNVENIDIPAATYKFTGWNKTIVPVTENATYKAEYDVTVRGYLITWKNYDGSVIATTTVNYGETPKYEGKNPKKPDSDTETFTFAGWDKTPVAATKDATYTATYTSAPRKYKVEWVVDDVVLYTDMVDYNAVIPSQPLPADKVGYTVKWDDTITRMPADEVTIKAIYTPKMYLVYWKVDGTAVYSALVPFGTAIPEKAVPAKEGHTGKWINVPATMPAGVVIIEAQYTARTYQVVWKIGDAQNTESATYGIDYVVTFGVANVPEELRITVGGSVLAADKYVYNSETGTLKIAGNAIIGNINIIAKSTSGSVSVVNSIFGGASLNSSSEIAYRTTYHATIVADAGYVLPKTIAIYVDGILITDGYTYDSATGKLTINAEVIVGEVEIYAECEEDPTYDATGECTCSCHSKNSLVLFFFKIFTFLRKLFGMSEYQYCGCGVAHW